MSEVLGTLLTSAARRDSLVHVRTLPAADGVPADWPDWVDADVVAGYAARGVTRPWRHQVEGLDALAAERHVMMATPTGSGKSLVAWAAAVTAIRAPAPSTRISEYTRRPTALYLSPTKALAADQAESLTAMLRAGGIDDVRAATVDGDAGPEERDWARAYADVVLTNPDFLHFSLLPGHARWQRLLRGLRYLVIDEGHAYRGVMGAHVSLVVRRLLRIAEHYGAAPQVVVASATIGEPRAAAARLAGVPIDDVTAVTEGTAPLGERTVALWLPPPQEPDERFAEAPGDTDAVTGAPADVPRRSTLAETADLLTDLVRAERRTLAFVRSRLAAEVIADHTRSRLDGGWRAPGSAAPEGPGGDRVAAYRGGYLPEERRDLERALRTGELLGLATTNALELGVDVSGLDAVVIAGWPGTRVSFWQQVGRAGRAGADGLAVLIASTNPLDAYLIGHPELIFETGVETTVFDPSNPHVLAPHLCAAAAEVPLTAADLDRFGMTDDLLLDELTARGLLRRRAAGWYWNQALPYAATDLTDLRGSDGPTVPVVEDGTGRVLGTVDAGRADATVHEGAIYTHQGRTYRVLTYADGVATVVADKPPFRTKARSDKRVDVLEVRARQEWGPFVWETGLVEVTSRVTGYDRRLLPDLRTLATIPLDLPERTLRTMANWWSVDARVLAGAGIGPDRLPGALHAAEHAAIGLLGLVATCDRWDIGGLSTAVHQHTFDPTVFVYDGFPGGAGFARRGFDVARDWIAATAAAVRACPCADGRPNCVQSPKCGNDNDPLDKSAALVILDLLLAHAPAAPEITAAPDGARLGPANARRTASPAH